MAWCMAPHGMAHGVAWHGAWHRMAWRMASHGMVLGTAWHGAWLMTPSMIQPILKLPSCTVQAFTAILHRAGVDRQGRSSELKQAPGSGQAFEVGTREWAKHLK
eukprot:353698-Chlamydomonas_euryale.AAC.5